MAYRVLARAYRSGTFDEVVGQEPIATTLKNAITTDRVHHGYLFTGTRGVGKTSMARILAKALNCLEADAPTITPCGSCDSCTAISLGEDVDVVEIDAASNTGVDNIRELRSNATLRPARSRFKVYIIDEVHMLSTGAFNALLKILEEPPSHVKFILATTESHKVPATIQSRCQRFDFRAIDAARIAEHLGTIAKKEKIKVDTDVLRRVARLANGSMRDALSLLDKLLSYESKHLTADIVAEIIPPPHDELAAEVFGAVSESDAARALTALDNALQSGRTVDGFCNHLIEHVRTMMLMRTCGTDTELVDVASAQRKTLADQAAKFDAPTYVYMIALLEELRRNVRSSGAARALADAAIVRLSMSQQFTDVASAISGVAGDGAPGPDRPALSPKKKESDRGDTPSGAQTITLGANTNGTTAAARSSLAPEKQPRILKEASAEASAVLPGIAPQVATRLTSAQKQRAQCDPFVQQVKDLFDGTIKKILPIPQNNDAAVVAAGGDDDVVDDQSTGA